MEIHNNDLINSSIWLENHMLSYFILGIAMTAFILVILEKTISLNKFIPVMSASGIIWLCIGVHGFINHSEINEWFRIKMTASIGELFFFLMVAMIYVNTLTYLGVFDNLSDRLKKKQRSYRWLFVMTGFLTFCMSPVLDNLTSAMLMANVAFTVERKNIKFLIPTSVGIILASNAGGAWSPFGDITLLMLWVADKIPTAEFVKSLAAPAIVCWIIFTMLTVWFVPKGCPGNGSQESLNVRKMKPGAYRAMICFLLTIGTGVCFHHFFHLPPYLGMLCGLTYLAKSFFMKDKRRNGKSKEESISKEVDFNALHFICGIPNMMKLIKCKEEVADDDENDEEDNIVSRRIKRIEFDALLFICGVLPMIGGLEYIGFFETVVGNLYDSYSHTAVNISMGAFSALFGSVPVVYAVLNIDKLDMNLLQWLLFALSTGIGCNLLPIGSVAGVAVMSISKGVYRFRTHLPYIPFIIISCAGSIALLLFLSKY